MTRRPKPKRAKAKRPRGSVRRTTKARGKPPKISAKSAKAAKPATTAKPDPFDDFVVAAARSLGLPCPKAWQPGVKANVKVTLQLSALFQEFPLPDEAEPAPVFKA
jgi:1-carboxybiuret hydrolase subunit AtzG-like protein